MPTKELQIAVVISAIDKMTRGINEAVTKSISKLTDFQKKADAISRKSYDVGRQAGAIGLAAAAPLGLAVKKFMDFEDSALRLKSTMLETGGVANKSYGAVNALAVQLGSELKGNTSDFQDMFSTMYSGGIDAESILNGVGKSAAYMGNVLDINYNTAAAFASKVKEATGVQNSEMMGMLDTLTKITQVMPGGDNSAKATELEEAFSRSSGQLKNLGLQGLETSKQVATVYAELIRSGAHGETVGTGFSKILESFYDTNKMAKFNSAASQVGLQFDFIDQKTGKFKGIENMVQQFDKMKGLNTKQRSDLISALLGDGQDANFVKVFANLGTAGYKSMMESINKQASLSERKDVITSSLAYNWEAAIGNLENTMADLGATLKPVLITLIGNFNGLIASISGFIKNNPGLTRFFTTAIVGFSGIMLATSGISFAVGAIAKTFSVFASVASIVTKVVPFIVSGLGMISAGVLQLTAFLYANPIVLIAAAIAGAAYLIVDNWAAISKFFSNLWNGVSNSFSNAWENIKNMFSGMWQWISGLGTKLFDAGRNIVISLAKGIWDAATFPIRAVMDVASKIRDFFPFSPAKRGALKDIHKIKLMETIAATIKPMPLIRAVSNATEGIANISGGVGRSSGSAVTMQLHYNPVVTMGAGSNMEDVKKLLEENSASMMKTIEEAQRKIERTRLS